MIELVILACLIGQPDRCEAFHVPFREPTGVARCLRDSQLHAVAWAEHHPLWRLRRVVCGLPDA